MKQPTALDKQWVAPSRSSYVWESNLGKMLPAPLNDSSKDKRHQANQNLMSLPKCYLLLFLGLSLDLLNTRVDRFIERFIADVTL